MTENEKLAMRLIAAIQKMTSPDNFDALNNFESYLGNHFDKWLAKFADTPEGLVNEFETFANMYDNED